MHDGRSCWNLNALHEQVAFALTAAIAIAFASCRELHLHKS